MELKGIYNCLSDLILILDETGKITDLNTSAQSYFSEFNIRGQDFSAVSERNPQIQWRCIKDSNHFVAIGQKKSLLDAEALLSSLLATEFKGLNIYWFDLEEKLLLCNVSQAKTLGMNDPKELQGKTLREIVAIWSQQLGVIAPYEEIRKNNQQIIDNKEPILFEEQSNDEFERTFLSYKAPFYDQHGNIQGILGISSEITETKILQKKLEKSKHAVDHYLESILMSSPDNIFWLDKDSRVIGCNDNQAKSFGLKSRVDLIGLTASDLGKQLGWPDEIAKKYVNMI